MGFHEADGTDEADPWTDRLRETRKRRRKGSVQPADPP